ncbi:F-box/kelch-repeat protein At3g06240-like [Rosa rugosa]|uniref:F-box/kelch-repeat protein At3g06240-like n=1 Tax=Rosa rugosa TaxID=74645 RepID=UPI002B408DC4|nr:F-box/kelch-repeat protein At3g06240-like [Rosa rugosa]
MEEVSELLRQHELTGRELLSLFIIWYRNISYCLSLNPKMKRILKSTKSSALGSSQIAGVKNRNKSSSSSQVLSMLKKEEGFDLPEDIVVKILCRLPVKTLIRFTCVSKRWRFIIISDPQFAKSHLQLALQQGNLSQRIHPIFVCESPQFQSWEHSFKGSVIRLSFPSVECEQLVRTTCNGLVLLGDSYITGLVALSICNPSTGFVRKIPSPRMPDYMDENGERQRLDFVISGFGYVSSTDDYKLVFVIPGDSTHFHVYIFSLRANSWKVIEAPHLSSPDCGHEVGTLLNEAIHWINYRSGVSDPASMYAFDLAEEEFREMTLPVWFPKDETYVRVLSSGGCLCMWLKADDGLSMRCLNLGLNSSDLEKTIYQMCSLH